MTDAIKNMPNVKKFSDYIESINKKINLIMLSGLTDGGKLHFSYATSFYTNKPICIITYNEMQAKKIVKDMKFFTENIAYFPKKEILAYDYLAESKDILEERINTLNNIYDKKADIVVTTVEAVSQKIVSKETLYKNILELKVGTTCILDNIKEKLIKLGYERYDLIEGKGQFSIRGGIIDIAVSDKIGVRIELFGDEIDSIRNFSISTQRSTDMLEKIKIYPAYEFVLERSLEEVCKNITNTQYDRHIKDKIQEDIEDMQEQYVNKVDKYFNSFYDKKDTLIDYLSDDYLIFLDEIEKIKVRSDNIKKDTNQIIQSLIDKERVVPDSLKNINDYIDFMKTLEPNQIIYLEKQDLGFVDKKSMHAKRNGYSFSYREVNFFRSTIDLLLEEIQKAVTAGKTTIILNQNEDIAKKMSTLLEENKINHVNKNSHSEIGSKVINTIGSISTGFESYDFNLLVISTIDVFDTTKKKRKYSNEFSTRTEFGNVVDGQLCEGAEASQDFMDRVFSCLEELKKLQVDTVLLVTHKEVCKAIDFYFNGLLEDKERKGREVANCEVICYEIE